MWNRIKEHFLTLKQFLGTMLLAVSTRVYAESAGDIARNLGGVFEDGAAAAQAFGQFIGICLIIYGGYQVYMANKTNGQGAKYSTGFIAAGVGATMFFLASVIETTGDTIWSGGGDTSRVRITR